MTNKCSKLRISSFKKKRQNMQYFQMFENYLNFRRKSEHKTSVWWSSFWASTTLSKSCPRKRATNPAREGWHEKFPANPPWRKLRMRSRRSAGGTRSRCWPISRCGSTLSPTNQARARNPTSSPSERSAVQSNNVYLNITKVFLHQTDATDC